jgi:hypothetical protein
MSDVQSFMNMITAFLAFVVIISACLAGLGWWLACALDNYLHENKSKDMQTYYRAGGQWINARTGKPYGG